MNVPDRRTIFNVVLVALLVVVIVPFVIYTVPQVVGAEHSYTVLSGSMAPAISTGDVVIVNEVSPTAVEEGDVITYQDGERAAIRDGTSVNIVTHRVIDVAPSEDGPMFKTKGDANEDPDQGRVQASRVIGRVMFTIPYIGHIVAFASTRLGFMALVGLPVGLLIVGEVYDLARAARNTRHRANEATDAGPQADADGATTDEGAPPRTDVDGSMTESTPLSGFDPGVPMGRNGAPVNDHDPGAESTDPATDGESEGMDDA